MKDYRTTWSIKENGKTHIEDADILDIEEILTYCYSRLLTPQESQVLSTMKKGQSYNINLGKSPDTLIVTAKQDIEQPPF